MKKHRQERLGDQFLAYITLLGAVPMLISTVYLRQFKQLSHAKIAATLLLYTILLANFLLFRNGVDGLIILLMGLTVFGIEKIFWQLALHRLDLSKATAIVITAPVFTFVLTLIGIGFILKTHSKQWIPVEQ